MTNVFERLKEYYLEKGSIMPQSIFKKEFSSEICTTDDVIDVVYKFNDFLNEERVKKVELLKNVNVKRQILIDRLITNGLNESTDSRPFQHLTLTELEREWQLFVETRDGVENG